MDHPVSTLRLWLLRACYLLLVVGIALKFWPVVFGDIASLPRMDGVVVALLSTLGLLSIAGLFFPLRMLPLLVFEIVWKAIWTITVALPHWQNGTLDDGFSASLFACAWALPLVVFMPWRYAIATFTTSTPTQEGTR